jgi:hypothetical protein
VSPRTVRGQRGQLPTLPPHCSTERWLEDSSFCVLYRFVLRTSCPDLFLSLPVFIYPAQNRETGCPSWIDCALIAKQFAALVSHSLTSQLCFFLFFHFCCPSLLPSLFLSPPSLCLLAVHFAPSLCSCPTLKASRSRSPLLPSRLVSPPSSHSRNAHVKTAPLFSPTLSS